MSTDNLSPDHPPPKKHITLQQRLLDYIREHKVITEEIYREKIGGRSVSAALHNIKRRGLLEPGEYILPDKMVGRHGVSLPAYRLVKDSPSLGVPQKEPEIDIKALVERIHEVPPAMEPKTTDIDEEEEGWLASLHYQEEEEGWLGSPPEVSSIMVGVKGNEPELIIMFKGDFKPLRHVMTPIEVRYLLTNLMAFIPKPEDG